MIIDKYMMSVETMCAYKIMQASTSTHVTNDEHANTINILSTTTTTTTTTYHRKSTLIESKERGY